MKRLIAFCATCATLTSGSFVVLMVEDRRLGVPLPFSVPIAFIAMLAAGPVLLALVDILRARRPANVQTSAPRLRPVAIPPSRRPSGAEGVVLLDLSTSERPRERAA